MELYSDLKYIQKLWTSYSCILCERLNNEQLHPPFKEREKDLYIYLVFVDKYYYFANLR